MISVDKSTVSKPSVLKDKKVGKQLQKIVFQNKPNDHIGSTYRHEKVKAALTTLYEFNDGYDKGIKCGYCESKIDPATTSEQIDHFRPKGNIRTITLDKNNELVRKENSQIQPTHLQHKGYFWLCYEWTNLLPVCSKCNQHKLDYFPLEDESTRVSDNLRKEGFYKNEQFDFSNFRATSPKLQQEKRLLLHPELDDVENHLMFYPNGKVEGMTLQGKISIELYNLNRKSLQNARSNIIKRLVDELLTTIEEDYPTDSKTLEKFFDRKISDLDNPKRQYSRFGHFIKKDFDIFIVEQFRANKLHYYATLISESYETWIAQQ